MRTYRDLTAAMAAVQVIEPEPAPSPRRPEQRVECGRCELDPVDRVAARVTAPASWLNQHWEHPKMAGKQQHIAHALNEIRSKADNQGAAKVNWGGAAETLIRNLIASTPEKANEAITDVATISERATAALQAFGAVNESLEINWPTFDQAVREKVEALRQRRFAIESESRAILQSLRDVREFAMSPDHEREMHRLREVVDTLERLRALQKDGTLDALVDVLLRLNVDPKKA